MLAGALHEYFRTFKFICGELFQPAKFRAYTRKKRRSLAAPALTLPLGDEHSALRRGKFVS